MNEEKNTLEITNSIANVCLNISKVIDEICEIDKEISRLNSCIATLNEERGKKVASVARIIPDLAFYMHTFVERTRE